MFTFQVNKAGSVVKLFDNKKVISLFFLEGHENISQKKKSAFILENKA